MIQAPFSWRLGVPLILTACLVLGLAGGCTGKKRTGEPDVLYIGNGAEPKALDPHLTTGIPEHHIQQNIFEALVSVDPKTLEPIPGVAEKWSLSPDGRTYTFTLRKNARWSNGDPVTAHDFVYSWTRLLEPRTAAEYAYQGYYFVKGKDFNTGKLKDSKLLGFKAVDDHTLVATLENATPFFLGLLYHHSLYPVHRKTIEQHGDRWTRPENIVTNGAFTVSRWETNKVITLVPNPHYWDKDTVTLKEVHFLPIENQDTEEKMFRSGKLHVTNDIPLEKLPHWRKDSSGVYQNHPYLGTYFYWFNVKKKPLDNPKVRRALSLAIDRQKMIDYVIRGGQLPWGAFAPPGMQGYTPAKSPLPMDGSGIAQAKTLLAEAGYPDGKGMPTIELLYNTHENHKKIAEALQQMWKDALGIHVTLVNQEWKVYLDTMQQGQYQMGRQGWIGDYSDPNTFLELLVSDNGNNRSGWKNARFDALIQKAAAEGTPAKRMQLLQEAESIALEEMPFNPLYVYTRNYLRSRDVKGWHNNIQDFHPLKYVSVRPER